MMNSRLFTSLLVFLSLSRTLAAPSSGIQLITTETPSSSPVAPSGLDQVRINEVQVKNKGSFTDSYGNTPAWVELFNEGSAAVELGGAFLVATSSPGSQAWWTFPPNTTIDSEGYLLVLTDGINEVVNGELHAGVKLTDSSTVVSLVGSDMTTLSTLALPEMATNETFGVPATADVVQAADGPALVGSAVFLGWPTPGRANADPAWVGPIVTLPTQNPNPRPDGSSDIPISAIVTPQVAEVDSVVLTYRVGYTANATVITMKAGSKGGYTAAIPAKDAPSGALVRWYFTATDQEGRQTIVPEPEGSGNAVYYGTIVADPKDEASLPILELYSENDQAPFSTGPASNAIVMPGGKGDVEGCSVWFNGTFYDGVIMRRRGSSSLGWPKPKVKVKAGSKEFEVAGLPYGLESFGLNSNWAEPGSNTFTREPMVWEAFRQMGVEWLLSFHVHVRFNGKYFGRFSFQEEWSKSALKRVGFDTSDAGYGPFWKANSGITTNLVYGLSDVDLNNVYELESSKGMKDEAIQALQAFTGGISGGSKTPRSKYLFDAVNLPQVINHMAAQTLILNQDRCTKNFMVYLDKSTEQWNTLSWDVESGFGIDRGLGGQPAPDYCTLQCEQWSSPLYCDHNHTQDLVISTPYGLISQPINLNATSGQPGGRRRLLSTLEMAIGMPRHRSRKLLQNLDLFQDFTEVGTKEGLEDDYDADATKKLPASGALGSYNYLADAVLSLPRTREMYMRRLRTLMDGFTDGKLEAIATYFHKQIREEAIRDNKAWGNAGNPDTGYQQIVKEQLPLRKTQLYETYGPGGTHPYIPDAQAEDATLEIGEASIEVGGFVTLSNPSKEAIDVSGWRLTGDIDFIFRAGTVVAAGDSMILAADPAKYKQYFGGQGHYVVGPFSPELTTASPKLVLEKP